MRTWFRTKDVFYLPHLELVLELLLDPVAHMAEAQLSLPQLGANMQVQFGRHAEAVPAEETEETGPSLKHEKT